MANSKPVTKEDHHLFVAVEINAMERPIFKRNSNASRIVLDKSTTQLIGLIRPASKPLQVLSLVYPKFLWPGTPPG